MLLAIDVGNTNLVLALGSETDGGLAEAGYRIETASVNDCLLYTSPSPRDFG